ncbi:MAG: HAD superfamily hydrolase (TIGR01490 family) [Gammaproteobacteria bacterium]|jgi:HAD superfamily hydrolase (TIGR01490 family)
MKSGNKVNSFTVLLLAGRRTGYDPICSNFNTRYKALAPVAGEPMIMHVLRNLETCDHVSEIIVLAQEPQILQAELADNLDCNKVRFYESVGSIAKTILTSLDKYQLKLPVMITTADNSLLRSEHINDFLFKALNTSSDLAIGMVDKNNLVNQYPESRRTWIQFQDVAVTGCNLFLIKGANANKVIEFWNEFETSPKKLLKLAWSLGPVFFLRYLSKKITLAESFDVISKLLDAQVSPILLENPDIAIDADKLTDIRQIESILRQERIAEENKENIKETIVPVVIFDLDRTITTIGTYTPFLVYYALRHNPFRLMYTPIIILLFIAYILKLLNRKQLKTIMFSFLLGHPKKQELEIACNDYFDHLLNKRVNLEALFVIRNWRMKGAKLILATASYDWMANIFARRLNFDQVIATKSIEKNGRILPGIDGKNCYGAEKFKMVSNVLGPLTYIRDSGKEIWFYTDHHSDIPLLEVCTHPVAVNPTRKLEGWVKKSSNAIQLLW